MAYTYMEAIGIGFPGVQCHAAGIGDIYEEIVWDTETIISKEALDAWILANPQITDKKITVLAFRNRFTQEEKITIELAAIDNPAATMNDRIQSAGLRVVMTDLATAIFIDLADPRTIGIVTTLEQSGIIGAGRADEILNASILPIERPHV